ncbi:putative DnaJ domain-containing protein [Medicago truncatula]|uniref:DnaJ heat shock amino-terminal domain protein n=1 Tax=Medicago truncatula TaxID=3880 RepID=A0A072UTB8_MEDTR|nr:J protein JJJ2 [Medicago truncatula]KEH32313.1 DnaJ heat shock amino-terminal domain protein [Medicago truncatula]RHN64310.1 putative DnaJ domain-containing protein [Medicago truncatula]
MGQESDSKAKLVLEICSISTRSASCVHRIPTKTIFIDWYCILGVEENAGVNTIRKRYHKLALQLHPDKNKHPKAEIAFKLVSEANACLTNAAKREAFDFERYKNFCIECKRIPYTSSGNVSVNSSGSGFKAWNIITKSRSFKFWRNIKDIRERFNEEAKVVENCMRVNSMSRNESPLYNPDSYLHRSKSHRFEKETPVFNPSDYLYQGYPHMRGLINKNPSAFWYLQTSSMLHNEKRGAQHSSPVFEVKSRSMFTNQFAFVPSRY